MVLSSGSVQGSGSKMSPCAQMSSWQSSWTVYKEATGAWAGAWAGAWTAAGANRVTRQQCCVRSSQVTDGLGVKAGLG